MNYTRPELADRLAAEYVLGTLRGPARRRFAALLPAHPVLRAAVSHWEQTLHPLAAVVAPTPPPARVWQAIEAQVHGGGPTRAAAPAAGKEAWWRTLGFWRGWAGLATACALVLGVLLRQPPAPGLPPVVVVLAPAQGAADAGVGAFVAGIGGDGRQVVVKPLRPVALQADHDLELWAVPKQGAPRSLGLIAVDRPTALRRDKVLDGVAAFAVSLEPPGGSPTGAPTGPILYSGSL
jgi:anti-sigma-K factor RskA